MPSEFSFSDARSHLTDIANDVAYRGARAVITRKGKKLVAIISIEDLAALEAIEDRIDLDDATKKGTVSWESINRKLKM